MKRVLSMILICSVLGGAASWAAETDTSATRSNVGSDTIAPGTVITMANWQQYRDFMPDGLIGLFEGKYSWQMPPDIRIEIAPTVIHPLPKNYLAATEKYSAQVRIVERPDGSLLLQNYMGGIPFPNPQEPHKGWKVLQNLWYRYGPSLLVDHHAPGCAISGSGNLNCQAFDAVTRQLAYNTDAV